VLDIRVTMFASRVMSCNLNEEVAGNPLHLRQNPAKSPTGASGHRWTPRESLLHLADGGSGGMESEQIAR
jgi:hypothetical protein